jgi:2-polyprenyl-3-methyl-5-hydroxy-6-metoxy-1,4-benzoquinol methylase
MRPWEDDSVSDPPRHRANELAHSSVEQGDATGWFDTLYEEAARDSSRVPWAHMRPNPWLEAFLVRELPVGPVLVVGCGLGDDAEAVAARGYTVTAFDVADAGIDWCNERFPGSKVNYETADLLDLPERYRRQFGFVVEIYTVQSMPLNVRSKALKGLAKCVGPNGTLLVISLGREDDFLPAGPPWAVARTDLAVLEAAGLNLQRFEDFFDEEDSAKRRFVAVYRRT